MIIEPAALLQLLLKETLLLFGRIKAILEGSKDVQILA
jgi:hypothetical protein